LRIPTAEEDVPNFLTSLMEQERPVTTLLLMSRHAQNRLRTPGNMIEGNR
jgi:hypothetical protein